MATFGTILPSDSDVLDGYTGCSESTDNAFLIALIKNSSLFERFVLFSGDGDHQTRQTSWNTWLQEQGCTGTLIEVLPLSLLPAALANDTFDLFYSGDSCISYLAELRAAFANKCFPVVGRAHDLGRDISLGSWRSLLHAPVYTCDTLLCCSHAASKAVESLLKEAGSRTGRSFSGQCTVLSPGTEVSEELVDQYSARMALGLPEKGTILLSLGQLSPVDHEDLHPVLLALAELGERYGIDDCYLYICGQASSDDDYVVSLVKMAGQLGIADKVLFNFSLASGQEQLAFRAADIFVSLSDSSHGESANTLVQAMGSGCPVVLSDWGGYREFVDAGHQGKLVPTLWGKVDGPIAPGAYFKPRKARLFQAQTVAVDVHVLTEYLSQIIKNPSLKTKMAQSSFEHAKSCYRWESVIGQFERQASSLMQQAANIALKPSGKLHSLHFGQVFSAYATEKLSKASVFQTSFYGRQTLSGLAAPALYDVLEEIIPEDLVFELLVLCLQPNTLERIRNKLEVARAQVDVVVLWAVKQGILCKTQVPPVFLHSEYGRGENLIDTLPQTLLSKDRVVHLPEGFLESVTQNLKQENERIAQMQESELRAHLLSRYIFKRQLLNVQGLRLLIGRFEDHRGLLSEYLSVGDNGLSDIQSLTEDGYLGACSIIFEGGKELVYKPAPGQMAECLNAESGLMDKYNHWCQQTVFSLSVPLCLGADLKGEYSFREYQKDLGFSSSRFSDLGLLSAFALCCGMSDLHLDNIKFSNQGIIPVDLDMCCHPEVLHRLYGEVCEGVFPDCWQDTSLSATRIEMLWDDLFEQDWPVREQDVEAVVNGFQYGLQRVMANSDEWGQQMKSLVWLPCRSDPVPVTSSAPILEQLECYDLSAVSSLGELKQDLSAQAYRVLKQLDCSDNVEELVSVLVKNWLAGCHYSAWEQPGGQALKSIDGLVAGMQKRPDKVISWLAVLYREWLIERFDLHE